MADRARHDVAGGSEPPDRLFPRGGSLGETDEPRGPRGKEARGYARRDRGAQDVAGPREDESDSGAHPPAPGSLDNRLP